MKILLILLIVFLAGCTTVATLSDDGKTLTIKGIGEAEFENGAKIKGEPLFKFPDLPPIKYEA